MAYRTKAEKKAYAAGCRNTAVRLKRDNRKRKKAQY